MLSSVKIVLAVCFVVFIQNFCIAQTLQSEWQYASSKWDPIRKVMRRGVITTLKNKDINIEVFLGCRVDDENQLEPVVEMARRISDHQENDIRIDRVVRRRQNSKNFTPTPEELLRSGFIISENSRILHPIITINPHREFFGKSADVNNDVFDLNGVVRDDVMFLEVGISIGRSPSGLAHSEDSLIW